MRWCFLLLILGFISCSDEREACFAVFNENSAPGEVIILRSCSGSDVSHDWKISLNSMADGLWWQDNPMVFTRNDPSFQLPIPGKHLAELTITSDEGHSSRLVKILDVDTPSKAVLIGTWKFVKVVTVSRFSKTIWVSKAYGNWQISEDTIKNGPFGARTIFRFNEPGKIKQVVYSSPSDSAFIEFHILKAEADRLTLRITYDSLYSDRFYVKK
ncbi:MAG: hypothetical protein IH946_06740 [Bacteroidetes bacterium]|nr:hypothetical protein [Bacteroidota bacterium]